MQSKQITPQELLSILELPPDSWKLHPNMPKEQAETFLTSFKKIVKKQHHKLVKRYHPDLPKNGKKEEKRMKQVNAMVDAVMQLKIMVMKKPQPRPVHVRFYYSTGHGSATDTSTSGTSTFTYRQY